MTAIYHATKRTIGPAPADEISRAQIAFSVSALDRYVHERVRTGMLEAFDGRRLRTPQFSRFAASLGVVEAALESQGTNVWLDGHIREVNAVRSFQRHDKIAEAMRLISDEPLWQKVADKLNVRQADLTTRLNLIVDWRNRIVHEFDADPQLPDSRIAILRSDVQSTMSFIGRLVSAVDKIAG